MGRRGEEMSEDVPKPKDASRSIGKWLRDALGTTPTKEPDNKKTPQSMRPAATVSALNKALEASLEATEVTEADKASAVRILDSLIENTDRDSQPLFFALRDHVVAVRNFGDVTTMVDTYLRHLDPEDRENAAIVRNIADNLAEACGIKHQYQQYLQEREREPSLVR
jgi:hypothetical protein